jgi:hypothetical protein
MHKDAYTYMFIHEYTSYLFKHHSLLDIIVGIFWQYFPVGAHARL